MLPETGAGLDVTEKAVTMVMCIHWRKSSTGLVGGVVIGRH
jgi:hypothetical protein